MEMTVELQEQIDFYINDLFSYDEQLAFEQLLQEDKELAQEVSEQKELIRKLKTYKEIDNLKYQMDLAHANIDVEVLHERLRFESIQKESERKIIIRTLMAAASITLLIAFSVLQLSGVFQVKDQIASYMELKDDIGAISKRQRSMWQTLFATTKVAAIPSGTCFSIASNGYLATNYHVVKNVDSINIVNYQDSTIRFKARIIFSDKVRDLSILKIDDPSFSKFSSLPFRIKNGISDLGEEVFTLGYSKKDLVFSEGTISSFTGYNEDSSAYQVSIPVNPGNSGGPLFDLQGNLIGIVSGKNTNESGATFAIKSQYLLSVLDSIKADTAYSKPKLPMYNQLIGIKKTQQIKKIQPFVFKVEVYTHN